MKKIKLSELKAFIKEEMIPHQGIVGLYVESPNGMDLLSIYSDPAKANQVKQQLEKRGNMTGVRIVVDQVDMDLTAQEIEAEHIY
jgi:hypothetical protein